MQENKFDMENAKFTLSTIYSTLSLVLEDLDKEHNNCENHPQVFFDRMSTSYIPALNLVLCSTGDLLGRM